MPATSEHLHDLLEQEAEQQRERLARALENGGLPTEEEAREAWEALNIAFDKIEALLWRIEPIAEADELPFAVTLEHVGVLTMLARDIEDRTDNFVDFAKKVRHGSDSLLATREAQGFSRGQLERSDV